MSDQSTTRQLVIFSLGEEEYALPITHVHEIIRWTEPRTVASEDPSVRGVISLRGKILPVFDLSTRLNLDVDHAAENRKIVIVETPSAMAGVIVDDVEEVLTVDDEQLDATGGWTTLTGEGIEGIAKLDDRLVVLLDPERIVAREADLAPAAGVPAVDGRAAGASAVAA